MHADPRCNGFWAGVWRARSRGSRRHRKAEETYRYVLGVQPLDQDALANLDRIYTSLGQWSDLAQVLEQRVKATTEPHELVELYAGSVKRTKKNSARSTTRCAPTGRSSMASTRATKAPSPRSADLPQKQAFRELNVVYERELETPAAMFRRRRSGPRLPTSPPTSSGTRPRHRDLEAGSRSAGEDPEALGALALLYESAANGPSSATCSSASTTSPTATTAVSRS